MHTSHPTQSFNPQWSADDLAAAIPRAMPALHRFEFRLPANAAALHRPRRRLVPFAASTALSTFRVRG